MFSTNSVLDTLRLDSSGFFLKEFHIDRTFECLQFLGKSFSRIDVANKYFAVEDKLVNNFKKSLLIRLVIDPNIFSIKVEEYDLGATLRTPVRVQLISNVKTHSGTGIQNYKFQHRIFWDQQLLKKSPDCDDILVINEKNEITETSRFNIFLFSNDDVNVVLTPSLSSGCINGVYRRYVMKKGEIELPGFGLKKVVEKNILVSELKNYRLFLANSVREVLPGELI